LLRTVVGAVRWSCNVDRPAPGGKLRLRQSAHPLLVLTVGEGYGGVGGASVVALLCTRIRITPAEQGGYRNVAAASLRIP
jgi:hypothetical protein